MAWEYLTDKFTTGGLLGGKVDIEEMRLHLNHLGQFDWELVAAVPSAQTMPDVTREIVLILKRRKQET